MKEGLKEKVLYLRDVMKLTFRQIGEQIGISRKSISRIYQKGYSIKGRSGGSRLDIYSPLIVNWYQEYPRVKAKQVYAWLKERGVEISYPRVAQYTRDLRKKREKVYHQLTFLPGEEGQVDWFFINHQQLGKLACFVLILSYSRYLFANVFPRSSFEFFIEGHLMSFSILKGIPHSLRYDNLKSVVLSLRPEIQYNPRFLEFCRHYGLEIRLCNPARANEKGRVERSIRSIREGFLNVANYSSLKILNQGLSEWVDNKNQTIHRTTGKRPIDLLPEEKLKPLPAISWRNVSIHPPVKTTKTAMLIFDTNYYSVPDYLTGKSLSVHSTPTTIKVYDGDKEVASHPRSYVKNKEIINPLHRSYLRLSTKAKMHRIYDVIKNLDPVIADFLLKNQLCGEDPQKTAYEIFKVLKSHSRGMIVSIVSECLKRKSPRLKTFFSYLHPDSKEGNEVVQPQNPELLNIDYQKRPLEVYDEPQRKS